MASACVKAKRKVELFCKSSIHSQSALSADDIESLNSPKRPFAMFIAFLSFLTVETPNKLFMTYVMEDKMNSRIPEQPHTTEPSASEQQQTNQARLRRRSALGGGVALTLLLLASIFAAGLVIRSSGQAARASGGAPTPTPTVSTPLPGQPLPQGSLYAATPGSLARIDLRTSKIIWSIQASDPFSPLVIGKTLFFENEDSTNPFLAADNTKTGTQLWQTPNYANGFLLGDKNMLYDSLCDFSTATSCHLYGLNASTGTLVWSYNLPQGNAWIALANGVLYGVSYTRYFALNAATGAPLWQKDLLNYTDQEANMTPVVRGNVLSFASCNTTKQSSGYAGCYLYAFNASTGQELWHMATSSSLQATPAIMGGVVYAGAIDGTVFALNEQNGQPSWSANAGGPIGQVLARAGMVYVETINPDGQSFHIEAFDAATHIPRWGQITATGQSSTATLPLAQNGIRSVSRPLAATLPFIQHVPRSGGPAAHPFVLEKGFIYVQDGANVISVLKATDGTQVTQYTVSGLFLNGFTVV